MPQHSTVNGICASFGGVKVGLPASTDAVLRQAMAKAPANLFLTAGALATALADLNLEDGVTQLFVLSSGFLQRETPPLPLLKATSDEASAPLVATLNAAHVPNWRRRLGVATAVLILATGTVFGLNRDADVLPLLTQTVVEEAVPQTQFVPGVVDEEVVSETAVTQPDAPVENPPRAETAVTQANNNNNNGNGGGNNNAGPNGGNNRQGNNGNGGDGGNSGNGRPPRNGNPPPPPPNN